MKTDVYYNKYDEFINFKIAENNFLHSYLKNSISYKIKNILKFISSIKLYEAELINLIRQIKPDVIMATSDNTRSSMILNRWAVKNKIPFIVYQPTFIDTVVPNLLTRLKRRLLFVFFNIILRINFIYKQNTFGNEYPSNYIFVWGRKFKNIYKGLKIEKNVTIVGYPCFNEKVNDNDDGENNSPANKLKKPVITICTEALEASIGTEKEKIINNIYKETVENNSDLSFVIKLHPRENITKYKKLFEDVKTQNFLILDDSNLKDVLNYSSVQISVNSFSSFEAVVLGIPIILVRKDYLNKFDYFNNEIELLAFDSIELSAQIRKALSKEYVNEFYAKRKNFMKSRIEFMGAESIKKIVNEISKIIERNV
jgi:hypothetical protein